MMIKWNLLFLALNSVQDPVSAVLIQIGSECIEHSNTVRNLGVLFDQTLSFREHVSKLCKSSHYHLRNISKIRKYLY